MSPSAPIWLDGEALEDAPLTRNGLMFADGVRELQEPRSRVRCWIVHGQHAERQLPAKDPRHGITERIRASVANERRKVA